MISKEYALYIRYSLFERAWSRDWFKSIILFIWIRIAFSINAKNSGVPSRALSPVMKLTTLELLMMTTQFEGIKAVYIDQI